MLMLLETIIYAALGFILMIFGYYVFGKITPYDFFHEIFIEKNPATGIIAASIFIAMSIIIRSAII